MNDFRETLYTVNSKGVRKWVYPTIVSGFFRYRRRIVAILLMLFYLLMPWISVGGNQAVFLDLAHRRFIFFGSTFWATDTFFLLLTLAILGLSLFFFTSLLGRVWCGWACPETVFLEFLFRPIEQLIEGSPTQRRKLDEQPWSLKKLRLKILKYLCFSVIAWMLASTALAYFIGRTPLFEMMASYPWNNWGMFLLTLSLMGVLLFQFGWFREQFCTVVCPYARFQSVLLDDSSLVVGYDSSRGEPRGKISRNSGGDCVDCGLCVKVCPTGIDIRNGLQLECIQCAACADACDSIMSRIARPLGLIRYDTERGLAGEKVRLMRTRVAIYGAALLSIVLFFIYSLQTRDLHQASIFHSPHDAPFAELASNEIVNHLEIHIENKSGKADFYTIKIATPNSDIKLILPSNPYPVASNTHESVPVFAYFPRTALKNGKLAITISVSSNSGFNKNLTLELLGPG